MKTRTLDVEGNFNPYPKDFSDRNIALQHLKYIKVPITSEFSFEVLKHGKIEKPGGAGFCTLSEKLVKVLNIIYTLLKND